MSVCQTIRGGVHEVELVASQCLDLFGKKGVWGDEDRVVTFTMGVNTLLSSGGEPASVIQRRCGGAASRSHRPHARSGSMREERTGRERLYQIGENSRVRE